mgnify:CR=1 FL=1
MERHIDINQFDYDLPDERIAKFPLAERSASKLLVYRNGAISESRFDRLGEELPEGAMLVFNNTKVIRARIIMHKPSGARIEVFCLEPHAPADYERAFAVKGKCAWSCIVGNLKKWKEGALVIDFTLDGTPQQLRAYRTGTGGREQIVRFEWEADLTFGELLELLGRIPIPPYLNRDSQQIDYTRYQTVYSKVNGSAAAPTAGLHFTPELLEKVQAMGVKVGYVTLHVGLGTFRPVKEEEITDHAMHSEYCVIPQETAELINETRKNGGRVICVGTTSCRTLESHAAEDGTMTASAGWTDIFIYPGYRFKVTDALITNFHLPESTLIMLVSALAGREHILNAYRQAVEERYRFFSFGDAMFIH